MCFCYKSCIVINDDRWMVLFGNINMFLSFQSEDIQQQIIRETFHLVSKRDENVCNFLEGGL